jgi:hypothetical protein
MELLSRSEKVMPRSGTKFSRANRETSFLPCMGALVPPGSTMHSPLLGAAPADSAHPLSFPACYEKAVGEQSLVSMPRAQITLRVYRSRVAISSRSRVSSAARHCSRMGAGASCAMHPDTVVSPKPASRTADNNLAGGKSEKKGQKIYDPSSEVIQNTATLEERNQKQNHF